MGESTTQTPPDKLPRYIPDRDKLCLSKEQAELVYEAVENGEQVKPLSVNSSVDKQFPVVYDLTWSILSTVVDYTECDKNSPYKEVNYSSLYSRLTDTIDLVHDDATNHWQERYEEVSCNLYTRNNFDDNNDVSTTYLGYYKSKGEERIFL